MPKVIILDYGVGNLFSLKCALKTSGVDPKVASSPKQLSDMDAMIMPGVGNFSTASRKIKPFKPEILDAIKGGTPVLGICLGTHLFFAESAEGSGCGLSLLQGKVVKLPSSVRIPHMGWNTINVVKENPIVENISEEAFFYFAHSYYPKLLRKEMMVAETTYGLPFASVIAERNVYGTQFHPEKSGEGGLLILKNFAKIVVR